MTDSRQAGGGHLAGVQRDQPSIAAPCDLSITFPWPDSRLSPNGTRNARLRARLTKETRERAARITADAGLNPVRTADLVRMTFHPPSARWDDDNVAAMGKATRDGIAEAMGVDDKQFRPERIVGQPRKGGAIIAEFRIP